MLLDREALPQGVKTREATAFSVYPPVQVIKLRIETWFSKARQARHLTNQPVFYGLFLTLN
jgi:hypothetical protein